MENNNKTFLDILRKGTPEAIERNNALTQERIQRSANRKLANGLSIQNATEIAKEQEETAKRLNEQEKAKQALNHLIEIDEQQGIKTDRMLTAVNRFTESLQYANTTEEAISRLSPEDRLVLTAYPTLYSTALRNANEANKAYLNKDIESRSIMDALRESRTGSDYALDTVKGAWEGVKAVGRGIVASGDLAQYTISRLGMSEEALKQAGDIERKVSTKNMYLKMAEEHPELRDYFLGKAKENEFDMDNQAFLASEEGKKYLTATRSADRAMDTLSHDTPLSLQINQAELDYALDDVVKTYKNKGLMSAVWKGIGNFATSLPAVSVAAMQSLPQTLAISGNPMAASTGLISAFSNSLGETLTHLRGQGKAIDEINYAKAFGLSMLATAIDCVGDRYLGTGFRTLADAIPGNLMTKWGKEFTDTVDSFVAKGLTTEQATTAAMRVVSPKAMNEWQSFLADAKNFSKKAISELNTRIDGSDSQLLKALASGTGKVATGIGKAVTFGTKGVNIADWTKESIGEGFSEASASYLQAMATDSEYSMEDFAKDALLGAGVGTAMQPIMTGTGVGLHYAKKAATPKYLSDSKFESSMNAIRSILDDTDYDKFDSTVAAMEEATKLQKQTEDQIKEVDKKINKFSEAATGILKANGISESLVTKSGQLINPENSGLTGEDLKKYRNIYKQSENLFTIKEKLEGRISQISDLSEELSYMKAGKGHTKEFANVEQLSDLQRAEDQATANRAKDFEALSNANKVKYLRQYEGMTEKQAKDYIDNLDTDYTAQNIIDNAGATGTIDAQKLQENIDYYGIDTNHLNQIKNVDVLQALADITDDQATVDHYNKVIKDNNLEKHKDLYRRVSTAKESANTRSEAIKRAKFNVFNKKLGKPTTGSLNTKITALQNDLNNNVQVTQDMADLMGYIEYGDANERGNFLNGLSTTGRAVYDQNISDIDSDVELTSLETQYNQYHNRHTKLFDTEAEAKKAIGSNRMLMVKEDPYATGKWVVRSQQQDILEAIDTNIIHDEASLQKYLKDNKVALISKDDSKLIADELSKGKSYNDVKKFYQDSLIETFQRAMPTISTRVKQAMGVLGYNPKSLKRASFSSTVRTARVIKKAIEKAKKEEKEIIEKENTDIDAKAKEAFSFNDSLYTKLKTKKLLADEAKEMVKDTKNWIWSNLGTRSPSQKGNKITVSRTFATQIKAMADLYETEYYQKAKKADSASSMKSNILLNMEMTESKELAVLAHSIATLIDQGAIAVNKQDSLVVPSENFTIDRHIYIRYKNGKIFAIEQDRTEPIADTPLIKILYDDQEYSKAESYGKAEAEKLFYILMDNSDGLGNTGSMGDAGRLTGLVVNDKPVETKNSPALQEDLFGTTQNTTTYLQNNIIKDLDSTNTKVRNNAIDQLKATAKWFSDTITDTTSWHSKKLDISSFSEANFTANNNLDYFANELGGETLREFETLVKALEGTDYEAIAESQAVKELINNPNKFNKVFESMATPLGVMLLGLAKPMSGNRNPANSFDNLKFNDNILKGDNSIDKVYNQCGNDPLTRNIVFNSIIRNTKLFAKISHDVNAGGAGNISVIETAGKPLRNLLNEAKSSGEIKVSVEGSSEPVSTQDNFHVVSYDGGKIKEAYTLPASVICQLGLHRGHVIYTDKGQKLSNPTDDIEAIHNTNKEGKDELLKAISKVLNGNSGNVAKDFLMIDFLLNSVTKNPSLNTTLLAKDKPLELDWKYKHYTYKGKKIISSNRPSIMTFAATLDSALQDIQQEYRFTEFNSHEDINTIVNGNLRNFSLPEVRNQLNAIADYLESKVDDNGTIVENNITIEGVLQAKNTDEYYRTHKGDLKQALISVNIWTKERDFGGKVSAKNIRDFVADLNKSNVTSLTPEEQLVANFLIEFGSLQGKLKNSNNVSGLNTNEALDRRNAKVDNPEFLNYLDTTIRNTEELKDNFTVNTKKGSVYQVPNIIDSLSRGISYPGITDTLEGRLLASVAPLIQQANIEASAYLNGKETGYNADSLLRLFMKEQNGSWFLPDNLFNTGIAAVFGSMPNMNTAQSEEFKNKLATSLASANPQVRMRINATLEQTKGTYSEELIGQVAIAIKKALGPVLTPKDSAVNPDILYKELAATAIESLAKAGYLKKTLIRTDPTAPDAGSIVTDPKDTKDCMVIYSANTEGKANAVVTAVHNCVQLTSDGRTVHGIYDFFGMENPSRNNFTAVNDGENTITEEHGNEAKNTEFEKLWRNKDYKTNYGRAMLNDKGNEVVRYFEENPHDRSDIHKWCQVNISTDDTEHWVTVPITALYSDRPTGTEATVLGVQANATQYLQPQQINMVLTKQIFGEHLDSFGVRPDGTVYHITDDEFPCGIKLDLHATQQDPEFYKFFGLEDAYNKYKNAGSSTQKAEAEEALNTHYGNIMDYLRFIVSQKQVWNSLDSAKRGDFNTWLSKRKFHFHLKNSVNARVMYDSVFNPRDASDIRMFFTTVRSKVSAEALAGKALNDLTGTESTMLKNSVIRGRNLILASSLGISWDKSTDDFISENSSSPMSKFYGDLITEMRKDDDLKQYFSNNPPKDPPSIEVIKNFVEKRLNGNVSITVPTFDAESRDYTKMKEMKEFTVNAGLVQFISEVCTSKSHLDGSLKYEDMFYIRGEIDGITNGTSLLLGKANKLSNALRDDTAELWNKVGITLGNLSLFEIKKRQALLGLGADAYLMQLLVTDSDIVDIIHTLENEQQLSGSDSNDKKYILEILANAFETNKDLAPQLTRDLMKTQAMPYNYLAGRASRQQKLLESLCTEFNHTIQVAISNGDEVKARELLRKFAKLNGNSITLHNYTTSETRLVTEDQIATISIQDLKQLSIDFANVANQKVVETINQEAAAKFVEAPGVKLAEIAEKEGMGKLANACDTFTSLLLAELIEEYNNHNGVISNSARDRIVERYLRCFPGPGGSLNALNHQGISVNKLNFKHAINEFIDSIFVPVKGGGITIRTSFGLPTSRGAGNVPMHVHMLDGTVVQDAIVHFGTKVYNLMIHDAVEGGVGTLFSSSKRMNQTHAYITLTENPWNTAVSMIEHVVEDIKGTMATGALSGDIFQKAADIHNITHPNQQSVQKDFAEKILMDLKAKSLESLIDKLNVLNELKQDQNKNLTFNQYYGGSDSAFTLGKDDFEYIDRNGKAQKIEYKDRGTYFDEITKVMIEKYEETQRLNTSAFTLINHIKYLTSNREDKLYPHIIYALASEPGKIGKTATANLDLNEYIRVNNLRNAQDLIDALDPEKGRLAQNYYNWLFNTPGVESATAKAAWQAYKKEYELLKEATIARKSDQNLYNFVTHMVNARLPNSNAIGDRTGDDLEYDRARTHEQLKTALTAHINSNNPYAANFASYYLNTLTEYGIVKPSSINEKFTRNINAQMLIQTKGTTNNTNKVLTGLLSVVASYKDTDQNSKELNYILNNVSGIFPTETSDAVSRLVPYDNSTDVTRIHIPTGEFDMEEWEAGFLEAEKEALASVSYKDNPYFNQKTGKQYIKTSTEFANAREVFRKKYFTAKINQIVQQIINKNEDILGKPGTKVQLVVEGNSYLGAMVATALAHHSFNIKKTASNRDNIQVAILPVEASPEKLEENWTLGILNASNPASTENPRDSVTIIAPQGSKPDPVLESMAHFYNPKASKVKGTSKSLTIPKWDIQGNKVHVGSPDGHNSGKMMSPGLQTQAIVLSKAGEFIKSIDSALLGTTSMTYQNYLDSKSLNDIPFFKADDTLEWEDSYSPNAPFKVSKFNIGDTITPYTTLGIHINTAKLIQTGVLEGADESSQIALNKIKNSVDMSGIAKKLRDTMVGKSKAQTQGISLFNHSVKLGHSIVNIGFIPSSDFIAIPKRLLANLSKNTNANEYFLGEHKITKDQYDTLFRIRNNNSYLNATNPDSHIPNFIRSKDNQVIVVSSKDLGELPSTITDELKAKNNFFTGLATKIEDRAYKSLDVYVNRIKNHRDGTGNTSVILFKDTDTVTAKGNFVGSYSIANLENAAHSDVTEFWEGVTPITDITSQAHREYSSYTSGADIARTGDTTLGNNIRALQDNSLADLPQALYGVGDLKKLFDHPVLSSTDQGNPILERTIDAILDTDIQVMIGVETTLNRNNTPLAITGIDAHSGRQFINISMQNVGSNIAENNREALAHELTHRVVAEGLKNENLLRQVRVLYEYVKANITEDDFQCDYATRREIMDYVFPKHRSNVNVLQEFLAYALTNKHLITAIGNMRVDSATIEALNARTSGLFNKICGFVSDSAINRMDEPSVQKNICQLFADMAKIAKKNWTKPEERLKYADPSFGMQYTDIDKHPDLDATRGIPVGNKALLGAIAFDYKQAQGSYDEFIRYISRDDYSEEHLGNSAYTPESIGLTRWIENCCRKFSDNLYGFMNMLVPIMGGTTESNQIYTKAALQLKVRVDQMRERLITAGTKYMRGLFDTCEIGDDSQISQDRRRAITDTILDTDFKALLEMYSYNDIKDMVANSKKLNQEIQKLLNYPVIQKSATYYSNACKGLANRMVHGVDTSRLGLRNAYQIFNKWGSNNSTTSHYSADGIKQIDTLITLYAIQVLSPENKERLLDLMELPKGEQLINGITSMHRQLMLKQERDIFSNDNNVYNIPKGWTHRLKDSDKSLQLIPRSSLEMYEYQGYEYITDAVVPPEVKRIFPKESDLVYVKHQHILNTPYVPGIAPTTRKIQQPGEQYTINLLGTGRLDLTVDPELRPMEFKKLHGIHNNQTKLMSMKQSDHPITEYDTLLEPIFNTMGKIIGYNLRPNDKTLAKFTKEDTEADHIFGTTLGNIAERHITPQLNQKTAENLANIYEKSNHKDRDFKWIGLNDPDEEVQLAYKMLPAEIRDYFQERYPGKGVPIEKQYFARIVGHKPLSAGDTQALEKYYNSAINAPMDYIKKFLHSKYAVGTEYWSKQMADIGKQALVIQSGSVTLYNWISNLMLLNMRGVSLQDAIRLQYKGWNQLQRYKELGQQIDDLKVKALVNPKIDISSKINGLQSEIENLDIYPLLKEGFYSSIASNEITSKDTLIDQALKSLPANIRQTMGYKGIANLLAARGTTVHKVLQDLAIDSDFVGRYALYTHLKDAQFVDPVTGHTTTMSEDKRMGIISDMFIDYTVPLPKPIEWAEKVGLYVFSKYMFRTQKNLYSILTSNWQEVGKLAIAQMMLGSGAMGSNPFQSLMLPGQVLSHLNTPGGLALDGLSGLPLVRLLN